MLQYCSAAVQGPGVSGVNPRNKWNIEHLRWNPSPPQTGETVPGLTISEGHVQPVGSLLVRWLDGLGWLQVGMVWAAAGLAGGSWVIPASATIFVASCAHS